MIMGPESLPYLLQMLFAMFYTHRSVPAYSRKDIQMYFGGPVCFTSSRLQRELLEPFSAIRECAFTQINGNVEKNLASSIKYKMRHSFESETELLGFSQAYLEKGDAAAVAGLTKAASFFFEQGSDFTFFAGQSYVDRYHPQAVNFYGFVPIASFLTTFDLRWAVALLRHRCYADVQRLAASVLGRQKQFRATISQRINFVVYCALASLGLGQTARFGRIMRGLSQGICDLGVFPTATGSTSLLNSRDIFPNKRSVVVLRSLIVRSLIVTVSYCNAGEKGTLQRIEPGEAFPELGEIVFPVAQDWSATAARYERRREKWARNLSVTELI